MYDKDFLLALDQIQNRVLYTRIQIQNDYTGHYDGAYIEGKVTGGNINLNGSSVMRRTANLQMIADEQNYNITDVNNIISINKKVKIQIGIKNEIDILYPDIIWFKLGTFVIANAFINHSLSGININLTLKDLMALLNGECGGTIPVGVIHSPDIDINGVERKPLLKDLVQIVIERWTELKINPDFITIPTEKFNDVYWKSRTPGYLIEQKINDNNSIFTLALTEPTANTGLNVSTIQFGDSLGSQRMALVSESEISSSAGETVASVLDKIKNIVGNYEYFFDVDGEFHFQEILDGLNKGSPENALPEAIDYIYSREKDANLIQYEFNDSMLISSYTNTPQYNAIKNDIVVWGVKGDKSSALRYHLAIEKKPTWSEDLEFTVQIKEDEFGVKRAYREITGGTGTPVKPTDWRQYLYLDYITGGEENTYSEELKEELPKIMDIVTGIFYAQTEDTTYLSSSMNYFLDFIDPSELTDSEAKRVFDGMSVEKIGRKGKTISDNQINCVFEPVFPDLVIILAGQENTKEIRNQCIAEGKNFTQVSYYMQQFIEIGRATNSAYNHLRSALHALTSYNEAISLQSLPIYYLDVNKRISVEDIDSGIKGNYLVNSISIPLTYNGMMTISASRALERI